VAITYTNDNNQQDKDPMKENLTVMRLFENIKNNMSKVGEGKRIYPDCAIFMPDYEVEPPFFTYKIDERTPSQQTGHKPRTISSDYEENIEYKGQLFAADIEFGVYGKQYKEVNEQRVWFEEFMQKQKENVKQFITKFFFIEQDEDEVVEVNQDSYIKQPITYYLEHQRIYAIPFNLIKFEDIKTHISRKGYDDLMPQQ